MISRLISSAVRVAVGDLWENVQRQLIWSVVAGLFLTAAFVFLLIGGYLLLARQFGPLEASMMLAGLCLVLGIVGLWMPKARKKAEKLAEEEKSMVETVDDTAQQAVDTLGPFQVATSAFMLGLTIARRIRGG